MSEADEFNPQARGTLSSAQQVVPLTGTDLPASIYLNSANGARAIELSMDGVNYFTPTLDTVTANVLVLRLLGKAMFVRFTGVAGDTWGVL